MSYQASNNTGFPSQNDNDQQSLLGPSTNSHSTTTARRPIQHYDSLASSSIDSLSVENGGHDHADFVPRRVVLGGGGSRRLSRRKAFGMAVAVGLVVMTITTLLGQDNDNWMSRLTNLDNDDDDAPYYTSSVVHLLPVPLLGRSKSYKAQKAADDAKTTLYLDPDVASSSHHHTKDVHKLLLGSSKHHLQDDIQISAPEGCEGTVLILRHCEKGGIREHCNYQGYERSVYLASLFGTEVDSRWPQPSYMFAETPGARRNPAKQNFREVETIMPLAEKFDLDVDTTYSAIDSHKLARHIHGLFRSGDMCGKLLVVSSKHSKIPTLASALACGPKEGCPHRYPGRSFDDLWQLKVRYGCRSWVVVLVAAIVLVDLVSHVPSIMTPTHTVCLPHTPPFGPQAFERTQTQ